MKSSRHARVRKGSTVWYWHKNLDEWKKGKVISVNRYHISVRRRDDKKIQYLWFDEPAIMASEPKPEGSLDAFAERLWKKHTYDPKWKLLVKLGIKKA